MSENFRVGSVEAVWDNVVPPEDVPLMLAWYALLYEVDRLNLNPIRR